MTECKMTRCFAYKNGSCRALQDTDFGKKPCPFYKTTKQNEKQKAEAILKYKARTGLDHYVDPNSGMEAKDDA